MKYYNPDLLQEKSAHEVLDMRNELFDKIHNPETLPKYAKIMREAWEELGEYLTDRWYIGF